ncbi:MAG: FAD-dependent oxidoreductase [Nitrospinota bacterium]|nr:FAD-dependent oxidoreductase [Nitrospinota bacterium]
MSKIERVVIIGGGIIGTTLACFLSRDSRKVTLVERDALARATTAKNTGVLALCSRPADHRATMAWYGRNVYENLKTELKDAFGIDPRGSMVILPPGSAASLAFLEETVLGIKALGAEAEILDGPEVKRRARGWGWTSGRRSSTRPARWSTPWKSRAPWRRTPSRVGRRFGNTSRSGPS